MNTLEKVEKASQLRNELMSLENEIRQEQRDCKHDYNRQGFDSVNVYFKCNKCGHNEKRNHTIPDIMKPTETELHKMLDEVEERFMRSYNGRG